jgi:1-Cys peroxiredoxin 6
MERLIFLFFVELQLKLSFLYPGTTGRNFDEVLRVLDSLQLASKQKISTPANWQPGEPVVISPSLSDKEAKHQFPQGWKTINLPSGEPYLRLVNPKT